jgi:hypothetical protein
LLDKLGDDATLVLDPGLPNARAALAGAMQAEKLDGGLNIGGLRRFVRLGRQASAEAIDELLKNTASHELLDVSRRGKESAGRIDRAGPLGAGLRRVNEIIDALSCLRRRRGRHQTRTSHALRPISLEAGLEPQLSIVDRAPAVGLEALDELLVGPTGSSLRVGGRLTPAPPECG